MIPLEIVSSSLEVAIDGVPWQRPCGDKVEDGGTEKFVMYCLPHLLHSMQYIRHRLVHVMGSGMRYLTLLLWEVCTLRWSKAACT